MLTDPTVLDLALKMGELAVCILSVPVLLFKVWRYQRGTTDE